MAVTVVNVKPIPALIQPLDGGSRKVKTMKIVTVAFDSSYPTGGEALTAADVGLTVIDFLIAANSPGYALEYDYTNSKIIAYYQDVDALADSALIQVPNATDLATALAVTRMLVIGDA